MFYCSTLQDFEFKHEYDCVWAQWVLTHLQDNEVVEFLRKSKKNICQNGFIFVKENVSDRYL